MIARIVGERIVQIHELLLKGTRDLDDAQLVWRPEGRDAATAPPIAWHLWHVARWADRLTVALPAMLPDLGARLGPGREIWVVENLAVRWAMPATVTGHQESGTRMDATAAAHWRAPAGAVLRDYAERAFGALHVVLSTLDDVALAARCPDLYFGLRGGDTTVGADVIAHLSHASRHLGMMEALRGTAGMSGSVTI